jgi:LacI family transcriptional regulator
MPRNRPVTLQDIARRAGVSKMTVSLALRGHPHASIETRDRLRKLAREMGYRPNPLIVANMTQLRAGYRSTYAGTIAFVGVGEPPARSTNTQNRQVFLGARRRAEALGYRLEWFSHEENVFDGRRLSEILRARHSRRAARREPDVARQRAPRLVAVRRRGDWPDRRRP